MPPYPALADRWWPAGGSRVSPWRRGAVLVALGCILLTVAAKAQVPFWPVPLTVQPLVVVLVAIIYGPVLGPLTVAVYLGLGVAGLPLFPATPERGLGLAYLAGPNGGYLVGCLPAAGLAGWASRQGWDRAPRGALAAMGGGLAVIYLCGGGWLAGLIGVGEAWRTGLRPFLPIVLLELVIAGLFPPLAWRLLRRRSRMY